jgi:Tol biopolymer transport system component
MVTFTPIPTVNPGITVTPEASLTIPTPTPERIEGWLTNENAGHSFLIGSGASLFFLRDADLWRARPDSSGIEQLTFGGLFRRDPNDDNIAFLHNPLVSPDGRFITFSNDFDTLYLVDVTGTQPVQELSARSDEVVWSPDNQKMAYINKQGIITLLDVTKGELTPLANHPIFDFGNLVFSPDGRSLAYNCCFTGQESPTTGEIRVITLANGHEDTVGETWSSIGGGSPSLCWISPNEVVTRDKIRLDNPDHCSDPFGIPATSPDKSLEAFLGLLSPDDDVYFRRLIVMNTTTDEILWQRDFEVILRKARWSLDGQQLFLHVSGEESWPRHGTSDDAIYVLPADGSSELKLILENAVLLNVIPAWETN